MLTTRPIITELWLSKEAKRETCLIDKKSGEIVANIFKISIEHILYATSFNVRKGYIKLVHENGTEYYKKISLKAIVEHSTHFVFTNKDTIINTQEVIKRCDWYALWIGEKKFKISRHYREEVIKRFNLTII